MMKVLLINPPSNSPDPIMPLGLAYVAAALETSRIPVEVIDAWAEGYSYEDLGREVSRRQCDIIGITIMSPLYSSGMRTVDIVRKNSNTTIVVGGPHPSALSEECLNGNKNIDFVIIGEGEKAFVELVRSLENQRKGLDSIKGVSYRQNGKIINTGMSERIDNLDALPLPARHLFPIKKYRTHPPYGRKEPYLTLITSRGCPFHCTYCSKSVFGSRYRAMTPQRVCDEIKFLIDNYKVREIHFYDDDFTMDMKRAEAISEEIVRQGMKICWSCTTRVDLVEEGLLYKMKKAGCWLISYGVESGNSEILKKAEKKYSLEEISKSFNLTKRTGIRTLAYFMLGLPGETKETIEETIGFSLKLNPDFVSWGITSLYPGSTLYQKAQGGELGGKIIPGNAQGNGKASGKNKAWHGSASPYGDGFAIIHEENLSREELEEYGREANKRFYLRPLYLLKFIFKISSLNQLLNYLRGGFQFLLWLRK